MEKIIKFVSSDHKKNYIDMINKFKGKIDENIDDVLQLLSLDEVYNITIQYIDNLSIRFNELLTDPNLSGSALFIVELSYSLFRKNFFIKSIASSRKIDNDTRGFIINIINSYIPQPQKVSEF